MIDTSRITPRSADELADALRDAALRSQAIVPWGAGTLQHLGYPPPPGAVALETTALDRIVEYNPADLTITVEAGTSLDTVQAALGQHRQWLPWDPPAPGVATIGGLLAANVSGPLRLGYGVPRDWALGMRVALGDGRLVKSGGKVVKNVAGYETHKLHIGALGTLGVIVEVTFKVWPLPERMNSLVFVCTAREDAVELAEQLRTPPLAPVSLVLLSGVQQLLAGQPAGRPKYHLLAVRFAGVGAAVERQQQAAMAAARGAGTATFDLDDEESRLLWKRIAAFPAPGSSAALVPGSPVERQELILRAGARPSALALVLGVLERLAPPGEAPQIVGYAGTGLAYARWHLPDQADPAAISGWLSALRAALAGEEGYVVVEDAPAALRPYLDLWGAPPPTLPLMRAIKEQWDPHGVLNPRRYTGGL